MNQPFRITKTRIVIALTVLAVCGAVYAKTRPAKISYETEEVSRGAVVHEITVTGSVSPFKKIQLQPEASGRVTRVPVIEGQEVKAGDVLLEMDQSQLLARIASQRAAVDAAEAQLAQLVAGATIQELSLAEAAVATARSKRDAALSAKNDAESAYAIALSAAGAAAAAKHDSFILSYDDAMTVANDSMGRLTDDLFTKQGLLSFSTNSALAESTANNSRLIAKGALTDLNMTIGAVKVAGIPDSTAIAALPRILGDLAAIKSHLEDCRAVLGYTIDLSATTIATYQGNVNLGITSIDSVNQALSNAKSAIELQAKSNDASVNAAKSAASAAAFAADAAEKALAQAQADLTLRKSGSRSETIAAQRANVAAAQGALAGLQADLAKTRILAPLDSTVTLVAVNAGETAQPGRVAVELDAHGTFEIVANVSEVDIANVAVGQPVRITLDAFPTTESWTGKVSFINPSEKVVEGVIFYETKVAFDQADPRVRSGMTANLTVETARREGVLRVPLRAVSERDGRSYVRVLVNGAPQERELQLGIENNQSAEALSGLAEGEAVIVSEKKD